MQKYSTRVSDCVRQEIMAIKIFWMFTVSIKKSSGSTVCSSGLPGTSKSMSCVVVAYVFLGVNVVFTFPSPHCAIHIKECLTSKLYYNDGACHSFSVILKQVKVQ